MEPIQLGFLYIYPFGLFFAVLLVPFFAAVSCRMKKNGLQQGTASWFALLAVPLCFVLSRLAFCLMHLDELLTDSGSIFRITEGGYLLWGAVAGILLASMLTGKITKQNGAAVSDSVIVAACLLIAALRLLCGLLFTDSGIGMSLERWFDPEDTELSILALEDYSFFERFPFAVQDYYENWCWAVFVLQALWASLTAFLVHRSKPAPGGKTARFLILWSCGSIALESMLYSGKVVVLPWLSFVKANQIICAVALLFVAVVCLRRLSKNRRLKQALFLFPQFLAAVGIIIIMEFSTFEKKLPALEWLPADACHLVIALACTWIALAFRSLWKKAYIERSPV